MSLFDKIFGATLKPILDTGFKIIDELHTSNEEKESKKLEFQRLLMERDAQAEASARAVISAKVTVMEAELKQSDKYTKRARPTVVYAGLALMFLSVGAQLFGVQVEVPVSFMGIWGGVVGIYSIGRTREKANGNGH